MKVPAPLSGSRGDLEQESSPGSEESEETFEQLVAFRRGKSHEISQRGDDPERPGTERRLNGVTLDPVRDGGRGRGGLPVLGKQLERFAADIEGDPSGADAESCGESTRTGADVDRPSRGGGMPGEETFPQFAKKIALGRPFVPSPFPVRTVLVRREESRAGRGRLTATRSGGNRYRHRTSGRDRRSSTPPRRGYHVGARAPGDISSLVRFGRSPFYTGLLLAPLGAITMPYYECPKCGGGYVIDVPPSARPICDRDGARLKKASDASYERNARRD
jgi:hypothetical protein